MIANIARLRFSPLSLIGGSGNRLIEEGGRQLLDLSASFGPAILGYSHPAIIAGGGGACASMAGASLLAFPNENAVALAEELLRLTPGSAVQRRVWFGHSGSDANDCAMRVVQAATGRSRFISFIGSYHGNLSGSMSISGHTAMTHTLPRAGLVLLPYPDPYRADLQRRGGAGAAGLSVRDHLSAASGGGDIHRAADGRRRLDRAAAGLSGGDPGALPASRHSDHRR